MPVGVIILLILLVLIIFNVSNGITYTLALSKWKSVILLLSFVIFYIIPPAFIEGVDFYIAPFFALTGYLIYLLFKLSFPAKSLFYAGISAGILYLISKKVLPQPIGLTFDPFFIYALCLTVVSLFLSYGKRAMLFNGAFSIMIFNTVLIITGEYNQLLPPQAFSAICVCSLLSYYPVKMITAERVTGFKRQRVFQTEASESFLIPKKIKRKKK
jgi:hypothetical protein